MPVSCEGFWADSSSAGLSCPGACVGAKAGRASDGDISTGGIATAGDICAGGICGGANMEG